MPPISASRRRFKSPYWDVPPVGYEDITPKEYKALQAAGRVPHSVVNPSSQILQGTKYAHPDPLESAKAAAAIITATILGNQAKTGPSLTRQARRLYVGNIPFNITENELIEFFQTNLISQEAGAAPPVIACQINVDKNFAFVEFRTVEDTTNAMALDGISCRGQTLKIRRPHDYQPGGGPGRSGAPGNGDGPSGSGGNSRYNNSGYANQGQSGHSTSGGVNLSTSNLLNPQSSLTSSNHSVVIQVPGMQGMIQNSTPRVLTEVLCLMNMVVPEELIDDEEYQDILDDIRDECSKYGTVKSIVIPRPLKEVKKESRSSNDGDEYMDSDNDECKSEDRNRNGDDRRNIATNEDSKQQSVAGLGKVFVEFDSATEAQRAQINLTGRRFAGRVVITSYFSRDRYKNKEF